MSYYEKVEALEKALTDHVKAEAPKYSLADFEEMVYQTNLANGWFESDRSFGEDIALLHSEVSEALEAFRDGDMGSIREDGKPEGVDSELADVLVRLLDTTRRYGVDLESILLKKLAYNATRGNRHGGKIL